MRPAMLINSFFYILLLFLIFALLPICDTQYAHFSDTVRGRVSWVIEQINTPWTGSYKFLGSSSVPNTLLLIVIDSSNGNHLGECTSASSGSTWKKFSWILSDSSLICNVSGSVVSKVQFPSSGYERTFSVRILADRGPRCFRDLAVQNERLDGCPPTLRRNVFQQMAFVCKCPSVLGIMDRNSLDSGQLIEASESQKFSVRTESLPSKSKLQKSIEIKPLKSTSSNNFQFIFSHSTVIPDINNIFRHGPNVSQEIVLPKPVKIKELPELKKFSSDTTTDANHRLLPIYVHPINITTTEAPILRKSSEELGTQTRETTFVLSEIRSKELPETANTAHSNKTLFLPANLSSESFDILRTPHSLVIESSEIIEPSVNLTSFHSSTSSIHEDPNIYACVLHECHNNGTCVIDENNKASCLCLHGFRGKNCEFNDFVSTCDIPCLNGGVCKQSDNNTSKCQCLAGNIGINCNILDICTIGSVCDDYGPNALCIVDEENYFLSPEIINNASYKCFCPNENNELLECSLFTTLTTATLQISSNHIIQLSTTVKQPEFSFIGNISAAPGNDSFNSFSSTSTKIVEFATADSLQNGATLMPPFTTSEFLIPTIENKSIIADPTFYPFGTDLSISGNNASEILRTTAAANNILGISKYIADTNMNEETISLIYSSIFPIITTAPKGHKTTTVSEKALSTVFSKMLYPSTEQSSWTVWTSLLTTTETPKFTPEEGFSIENKSLEETIVKFQTTKHHILLSTTLPLHNIDETTRSLSIVGTKLNGRTVNVSKSPSNWLVASSVVLLLIVVVAVASIFGVRYVKRSRKLHGKYNPAKEENAFASGYSIPMTSVVKEERLI